MCIYTSDNLNEVSNMQLHINVNLEFLLVSFVNGTELTTVGCFYRPPSTPLSIIDDLQDSIFSLQPTVLNNFVLIGDFNINFTSGCSRLTNFMQTLDFIYSHR